MEIKMDKQTLLSILKLLSALESWGFSNEQQLPHYLQQRIERVCLILEKEILK